MSVFKKIFYGLCLTSIISPASAGIFIYHAPSYYNVDSDRLSSASSGVYISTKYLELGYEDTDIVHFDGHILKQEDKTIVLRYTVNKTLVRLGVHDAVSEDLESRGKSTVIFEVLNYEKNVFGNSLYYTRYRDETDVWQFATRYGKYYWGAGIPGTLYLQVEGDVIAFRSTQKAIQYYSIDFNAHLQVNTFWGVEIGGWYGIRRSAVTASGFVVYNRNDLYNSEARLRTTFNLSKSLSVKLGVQTTRRKAQVSAQYYTVTSVLAGINYEF